MFAMIYSNWEQSKLPCLVPPCSQTLFITMQVLGWGVSGGVDLAICRVVFLCT